ncbi:MAG: N-acetyl-gamma-glutamyl-phosphate reductase [Devosiaceae bacterium]|nr:N-acetyl-gamma-glutamyl-phosphate reductase [Devosiaceae bacterium]
MKTKIFIDGEAGTTGLQIRERLADRSDLELFKIPDEKRKDIGARTELLNEADIAILCLPDEAARQSVSLIKNSNTRVIDASSAFRVHGDWSYGFPEMHKDQSRKIAQSKRVSNPGCYPQGPIIFLAPLIRAGLIPADMPISVNAISGYSGGGRQMIEKYEAMGDTAPVYSPYGLDFNHKHLPEMTLYCGLNVEPVFQPAVGNYAQGMMSVIPLNLGQLANVPKGKDIHQAIGEHLAQIAGGYVELMEFEAGQKLGDLNPEALNNTNRMQLYVFANDDRAQALLVAVYDNLGKGASGAAVQNLDLMIGL